VTYIFNILETDIYVIKCRIYREIKERIYFNVLKLYVNASRIQTAILQMAQWRNEILINIP